MSASICQEFCTSISRSAWRKAPFYCAICMVVCNEAHAHDSCMPLLRSAWPENATSIAWASVLKEPVCLPAVASCLSKQLACQSLFVGNLPPLASLACPINCRILTPHHWYSCLLLVLLLVLLCMWGQASLSDGTPFVTAQ